MSELYLDEPSATAGAARSAELARGGTDLVAERRRAFDREGKRRASAIVAAMPQHTPTVLPTEPVKAGKGGEGGDFQITNAEFIAAVFTGLPEGAFAAVCSKSGDPSLGGWLANRADQVVNSLAAENNNYLACSSFYPGDDGLFKARHIAHFILVGLYTGTRSSAICRAALVPTIGHGHVDLEQGVFYRRAIGRRQTKKRQPPVRLPQRLLAQLRRWSRHGLAKKSVVEWNGKEVASVRKGFEAAVRAAGLGADVTPDVLRHTCATWLMQKGVNLWDPAGFLGMTVQQLEKCYGHHHPD
jgi:hypothetical protein